MVATRSSTHWNTSRRKACRASLDKKPSTASSQEHDPGVQGVGARPLPVADDPAQGVSGLRLQHDGYGLEHANKLAHPKLDANRSIG